MTPEVLDITDVDLQGRLRFELDGEWTVHELLSYLEALNNIYEIELHSFTIRTYSSDSYQDTRMRSSSVVSLSILGNEGGTVNYKQASQPDAPFEPSPTRAIILQQFPLVNIGIRIESPGYQEVLGFIGALAALSQLIIHFVPTEEKKLKNQQLATEISIKQEELKQKRAETYQKIGLTPKQIRMLTLLHDGSVGILRRLYKQGKIKSIRELW